MKKVMVVQFRHETNSFCPSLADEAAFRNFRWLIGEEVIPNLRGLDTELSAFLDVFLPQEDIQLIPVAAVNASPSGPVTADVYEQVTEHIVNEIRGNLPLHGICLDIHGAMVAQGHTDGEGDLLEMIRKEVGQEVPIMTSLDLHANVTPKMAKNAKVMLPYKTYPHVDIYETGRKVALLMQETLRGNVRPVMGYRHIPYLLPLFPTDDPKIKPLYQKAEELQSRSGMLHVRFTHGFFASDIPQMGMAVIAIADGDARLADAVAEEMAAAIIERLPTLKQEYTDLDAALDKALLPGDKPVVLADACDNPGAGGVGDTTHLLRRILERGITGAAIATILDPASVEKCFQAGEGALVDLHLGGWSDPAQSGGPLMVKAKVRKLTNGKYQCRGPVQKGVTMNHGNTAVCEIAGNLVIITSISRQPLDIEVFRSQGIVPEEQKLLVVKSTIHYKASFGAVAREMLPVILPGCASPVPESYTFKNWKTTQ